MRRVKIKNGKEIRFRGIRIIDAKEMVNFVNSLIEEDALIQTDKKTTLKKERKYIRDILVQERINQAKSIVAVIDGKIAGSVGLRREPFRKKHLADLGIAVKKEYRNSGIGSALLQEAINQAQAMSGLEIIALEVSQNNLPAIHLYEKAGFKKIAAIPKVFKYKGKNEDLFVYHYYLKD